MKNLIPPIVAVTIMLALFIGRGLVHERSLDYTGPAALADALFALGFLGFVLLLAGSVGQKVLQRLGANGLARIEMLCFTVPVGLGILAYGILALGLLGWIRQWTLLAWLAALGAWTYREWSGALRHVPRLPASLAHSLRGWTLQERLLATVGGVLLLLCVVQALTPPWSYDALMYHLPVPRMIARTGRISLLPEYWQANGPLTLEMLFALGLAWGSDSFARLLHLACGLLLVLATFSLGRRLLGRAGGPAAASLLLTVPTLPLWASAAYVDVAWALYELLALSGLYLWRSDGQRRWLVLAGLFMGWALGSKYLAMAGLAVLGIWVFLRGRHAGWIRAASSTMLFGGVALLVASPWYLKSWLLAGNPIYPFVWGGVRWDSERVAWLMAYLQSFGMSRDLVGFLLLPWNLYVNSEAFNTFFLGDSPGLVLALSILAPLRRTLRDLGGLGVIAVLRFGLWALGSQQIRFLLPILPVLALLSAALLLSMADRFRRWRLVGVLLTALPIATVLATSVASQLVTLMWTAPFSVIAGSESKDAFLSRMVNNHGAIRHVMRELAEQDRVLFMWDAHAYYCDQRCVVDTDHSAWTRLAVSADDLHSVARELHAQGITHLLFTYSDAEFLIDHDPVGIHRQALSFFLLEFLPQCGDRIYQDAETLLVKLTCG